MQPVAASAPWIPAAWSAGVAPRLEARKLSASASPVKPTRAHGGSQLHGFRAVSQPRRHARRSPTSPQLASQRDDPYDSEVTTSHLPGGDLIASGIADLARGAETPAALLVSIGEPRLRRLGIEIGRPLPDPERRLYTALAATNPRSAHSRFNALIRRLVSFERAAECAS